jgi:hypothetical protein
MKDQVTETQLKEIEKRLQNATPGPWKSYIEGRDHTSGSNFIRTNNGTSNDIELLGATLEDQDFIAAARQDVPLLLAEVRRLQKQSK